MTRTATAELYLHAAPDVVAAVLPHRIVTDTVTVDGSGDWAESPWSRSLIGRRRTATWGRGRRQGPATIDLVPAERDWTLVTITLEAGTWGLPRPLRADADAVARCVRRAAEQRQRPGAGVRWLRDGVAAADRPAALAVGYSRA